MDARQEKKQIETHDHPYDQTRDLLGQALQKKEQMRDGIINTKSVQTAPGLCFWLGAIISLQVLSASDTLAQSSESTLNTAISSQGSATQNLVIPSGLVQLPQRSRYYSPYAFVVDKTARTLAVWQQTTQGLNLVAQFPADLGKNNADKRFKGDHATPEGIYFLQERLEGANLDFNLYGKRAFTTDYPNFFDRMEGKTGYGIWLHAVPDKVPLTRGSRGCVVVRNEAILGLSQYVTLGRTPLLIHGKTDLIPPSELEKTTQSLSLWLEGWRSAWEAKKIDDYISAYSEEFKALQMNRSQWRDYKASLNEKYKSIQVRISRPAIFADRNHAVIRFLQEYTSDQHSDFGEKVLWLKKDSAGQFHIVGETWTAESSQIAREEIEATTQTTAASMGSASLNASLSSSLSPSIPNKD
jgi:murein L,D-transpeptidase YafK